MEIDVRYLPAFAPALVTLDADESLQVEAGSMVAVSPEMRIETVAKGGLLKSLSSSLFGGESFFLNTFSAPRSGLTIALAPPLPGDISVIQMHDESLLVQSGSCLASSEGISIDTKWS
jgi:uncharacterized protein (TIGR00266 family)